MLEPYWITGDHQRANENLPLSTNQRLRKCDKIDTQIDTQNTHILTLISMAFPNMQSILGGGGAYMFPKNQGFEPF